MLLPCVYLHLKEDPFLPPGSVAFSIKSRCLRGEGLRGEVSSQGHLLRDSHIFADTGPTGLSTPTVT